jgi:hypothetical protein
MGRSHGTLGQNFSKEFWKILKESSPTLKKLSQSGAKKIEKEIWNSASAYIALHWGKIFLSSKS